jgi:hypothetical protein
MNWNYVREHLYLVPLVPIFVAVVLSMVHWMLLLIKHIQNRRAIRAGARNAREVEKGRKKELTRLTKQMGIGDPIFWMLFKIWDQTGHLLDSDRKVSRNSNCNGAYRIEVDAVNLFGKVVDKISVVTIDLRLAMEEQISIEGRINIPFGVEVRKLSVNEGVRWIMSNATLMFFGPRSF